MRRTVRLAPGLPEVCRLGLATYDGARLGEADVLAALDRGLTYWNWCGRPDGMAKAAAALGARRRDVVIAFQLDARTAAEAVAGLEDTLRALRTDYVDVATGYYVESAEAWDRMAAPEGALGAMRRAQREGKVRLLGLTSHQRALAVRIAAGEHGGSETPGVPPVDLLMLRYNAAHRGAETDVFPAARRLGLPVVSFTAQRWGALSRPTPDDPPGFAAPGAREWYRFVLSHDDVAVTLTAPTDRAELDHNLGLLDDWRACTDAEREALVAHGDRVRRHAGAFG